MANIILPQVNILNEINDSATMLVEQNGEINRFSIADLDIGGGDVTINLEDSNISKPNPVNADTLGGRSPEEYIALAADYTNQQVKKAAPRNLLDNSDFRNPVNQRGQMSYTNNNNTIDRWLIWNANNDPSLTVNSGNITVNAGSTGAVLQQRFSKGFLDSNKQYTAVIRLADGSTKNMNVAFDDTYDCVNYYMDAESSHNIEWAALYEGEYTADTLPEYQPKGYANELLACNVADIGSVSSIKLLWENASPTSSFEAQTINVDLSGYDIIFIQTTTSNSGRADGEYQSTVFMPNLVGVWGAISSISTDGAEMWGHVRRTQIVSGGVRFENGHQFQIGGSIYYNWPARAVPVAIYGIKGVSA